MLITQDLIGMELLEVGAVVEGIPAGVAPPIVEWQDNAGFKATAGTKLYVLLRPQREGKEE